MYIHIHIHIYIYTWAITPVTNLQPQFQGIQKSALAFRLGCGHALVHHILRDLQTICTRIFCGLRCENGEASRGVPVGLKRNHGKWNLKGTKKTNNNSCPVCSDFEIFEVLLHLEILSDFTPRIRVAQPRPLALTQSATTPLTSAMVSSDMFWPPRYHMYSPFTKKKPCPWQSPSGDGSKPCTPGEPQNSW